MQVTDEALHLRLHGDSTRDDVDVDVDVDARRRG